LEETMPNYWTPDRNSRKVGNGNNRTESKAQHISRSGLKTQKYCDAVDARRGVAKRYGWYTVRPNTSVKVPPNWGRSKFPVGSRYY
jgi:hypothetical protein